MGISQKSCLRFYSVPPTSKRLIDLLENIRSTVTQLFTLASSISDFFCRLSVRDKVLVRNAREITADVRTTLAGVKQVMKRIKSTFLRVEYVRASSVLETKNSPDISIRFSLSESQVKAPIGKTRHFFRRLSTKRPCSTRHKPQAEKFASFKIPLHFNL